MTQIKFYYNQENKDLFAVFPKDYFRGIFGNILYSCYSYVGEHSTCDKEYIMESRPAQREEYTPLLNDMIRHGYSDIEVLM